jgi:phage protein D
MRMNDPGSAARAPVGCVLRVDDVEITDLYPLVTQVDVQCRRGSAWTARVRLETYRDNRGRWAVEDSPYFAPWDRISIAARFGTYEENVLTGFVRQVSAEHPPERGRSTVTVECQDTSLMMDREQVRKRWGEEPAPTSDRSILTQILAAYPGLVPAPTCGTGMVGLVGINQNETDIQFLRRRADANGYELAVWPHAVHFGPMRLDEQAQGAILVYAGDATNCLRWSLTVDGHAPDKVAFDVADPATGAARRVTVEPDATPLGSRRATSEGRGLSDFVWLLSREGSADDGELRAVAQQKVNELSMKIRAEGELDGAAYGHVLRAGEPVAVDGVGDRHSGSYYVDSVDHSFSASGYRQRFVLLRNALDGKPTTISAALATVL